ncbi:MarR family winged helix-turn-helix transcriptional regulator [Kibdelosporangium persicum]|uniref:DNA-binding MarR family transcriptional regulator n=1 Tax=Kibdelosporangium persicum TaxID=2698649 RepID=A0ABX2F0Z3_9PSEU|nr:MarR family transcriptional regulator [Kibdelosporangium persicum]NRN64988.1 DNA-binding MarR family transcriptional regulator [Kibdelosporangium persicum]
MTDLPLTAREEALWRALARLMVSLPRALDDDLLRDTGLSLTDYSVLMHLSEAENQQLRMADLATATALSASRIPRVVDNLRSRGLVEKRRTDSDGRGYNAVLTPPGLQRLRSAYPTHLASVRKRVVDLMDPDLIGPVGKQLVAVAERLYSECKRQG